VLKITANLVHGDGTFKKFFQAIVAGKLLLAHSIDPLHILQLFSTIHVSIPTQKPEILVTLESFSFTPP
jgi:hypothetical protein